MYVALNFWVIESCSIGKSNLYRRSDIDQLDATMKRASSQDPSRAHLVHGLAAFGKFLAEDAMIGMAIWHELDLKHELGYDVVGNSLGEMTFMQYFRRRVRWIRVRKHIVLAATLLEPFTESVLVGMLATWAFTFLTDHRYPPLLIFLIHLIPYLIVDLNVRFLFTGVPLAPSERVETVAAWLGREFLAFPIWLFAIWGNEVDWRGAKYRVMGHGITAKTERADERRRPWAQRIGALFSNVPEGYEPVRNLEA